MKVRYIIGRKKINHGSEMILAEANEIKNNWAAGKKLEKPFGENV